MSLDIALLSIYIPSYYTTSHHITSPRRWRSPWIRSEFPPAVAATRPLGFPAVHTSMLVKRMRVDAAAGVFCRIGGCFWSVCGCVCVHWHVYVYIPIYTHTPSKIYYIYTVELFWLQNITVVKQSRNWMAKKNRPQTWKSTKAGFRWTCF